MDLNEKLAARRRELAIEAEKARLEEHSVINAAKEKDRLEIERAKKAKQDALVAEISRRSENSAIEISTPEAEPPKEPTIMSDADYEKALNKAATDRMTSGENTFFAILIILGIVSLFVAWPMAVAFIIWAGFYINGKSKKYKAQILAEGKARTESKEIERESGLSTP